jgi:hypothetical protein
LWQGLISPTTVIVCVVLHRFRCFTTKANINEVQNNGNWYDFGIMFGVACAFNTGGWASIADRGGRGSQPATNT